LSKTPRLSRINGSPSLLGSSADVKNRSEQRSAVIVISGAVEQRARFGEIEVNDRV
jgi:hypothetical protein